ncbi:MAG TPA: DinB family protein [Thermomicrobiales bacterium]|nr:DinB family protein [Thermomicrobiales bacterium]
MDAFQAVRTGTQQILREQKASMREIVSGLDADALNWKPGTEAGAETNSIAQMLSHALDAERFLIAAAVDDAIDRDREAHFRVTVDGASDMLALIDSVETEVEAWLSRMTAGHLSQDIARPGRTHSGAWWLLHAVEHSREHVGQAFLTRQLYELRAS